MDLLRNMMGSRYDRTLKYMNKYYGEPFGDRFTIVNVAPRGFDSAADRYTLVSEKYPGMYVHTNYFKREYDTDYMEMHYYKRYQDLLQPIFEEVMGECRVLYNFKLFPSAVYNYKTKFEDFITNSGSRQSVTVPIRDDSDIPSKSKKIAEKLKKVNASPAEFKFMTVKDYDKVKDFKDICDWGRFEDADKDKEILKYYFVSMSTSFEITNIKEGDWYFI